MRINRTYALAASAWLVLVVVGAILVWAVISRAGQSVVTQPGPPIGEAAPISSAPSRSTDRPDPRPKQRPSASASPSSAGPSAGPSRPGSPASTPNSGPPPPAATSAGGGSAPGPGAAPGPGPSASPNDPPPSSSPPPPKSTQDSGVRRTWQGSAGVVTVECRGQSISLQGAQPNSGWSIEIDSRGPGEVRVDFDSNDGDRRTRVQSECVGGSPRFEVDTSD